MRPAIVIDSGHLEFTLLFKDRKSTRLNSSHGYISYAVFCLKKQRLRARLESCVTLYTEPGLPISRDASDTSVCATAGRGIFKNCLYQHPLLSVLRTSDAIRS